jgi:hypothetical protein
MTDLDLRDLFQSAAPEPQRADPADVDRAWRDGCRRRVRSRATVVGAVGVTVAAAIGVAVLDNRVGQVTPAPAPSTQSPTVPPQDEEPVSQDAGPDTTYAGAPVWVSPTAEDRADLPSRDGTGLPSEIDLSSDAPSASETDRAVGVLGVLGADGELSRVAVVGTDGGTYSLDIDGRLERVTDEGGNAMSALSGEGLSPDGTHVFFRQERALVLYDFAVGTWTEISTPRWTAETAQWADGGIFVPAEPWGLVGTVYSLDGTRQQQHKLGTTAWSGGEAYGPERSAAHGLTARSYFLTSDSDPDAGSFAGVNAVVVSVDGQPRLLVHDVDEPGGKLCCPVADWLEPDVVAFQSGSQLLAWEVPGGGVSRVTDITGLRLGRESYVASWAFPARDE